jgi:hypothetical protein
LTTIHEKLIYTGKYLLKATNFYTNYIIASNTAFEYTRRLWYSLSRNDYAWISAHYTYCNKEKAQKNNTGVIPIQSHYPGQCMVLDLMDFRISIP